MRDNGGGGSGIGKIWLYADNMLQVSFGSSSNRPFATQLEYKILTEKSKRNGLNSDEQLKGW